GIAADSLCFVDLNGRFAPGGIAQVLATTPGASYEVTFFMAGNPDGGPGLKEMSVNAAGQTASFSFVVSGQSAVNLGWESHAWQFTAVSQSTTLEFATLVNPSSAFGPLLDHVSVHQVGPPPILTTTLVVSSPNPSTCTQPVSLSISVNPAD